MSDTHLMLHESLFLRHVQSRWLALLPALVRVLLRWETCEYYFLDFFPAQKGNQKFLKKKSLQGETIPDKWWKEEVMNDKGISETRYKRVDHFFKEVFKIVGANGAPKSRYLPKLVKSCLSLHHGNAHVERSLSDNKNTVTPERMLLSDDALKGLRRAKEYCRSEKGVHNARFPKQMIEAGKHAHRTYKRWTMKKKQNKRKYAKRKLRRRKMPRS